MDEDECTDTSPVEIGTRYKLIRPLGKGAYGKVYEATDTMTVFHSPVQAIRSLRELIILRQCNHPNICKLKNVLTPPDSSNYNDIWMVLDHGGRDLLQKEKAAKILGWNIKNIKWILYQLIYGMSGIIHRDLKPSNILIGDKLHVIISDFGLARQINEDLREPSNSSASLSSSPLTSESPLKNMTKHVVTRFYRAPELCLCQSYNEKIDVWAVGCIMSELFGSIRPDGNYCQPLFPGSNSILSTKDLVSSEDIKKERYDERSQFYRIMRVLGNPSKNDLDWIEDEKIRNIFQDKQLNNIVPMDFNLEYNHIEESGIKLLKEMLEYNPHKRISMSDALKSTFFDEVRDEELERDFKPFPMDIEWEIDKTLPKSQQIEILRSYTSTEIRYYKYSYTPTTLSTKSTPRLKPMACNSSGSDKNVYKSPVSSESTDSDSTNRILEGILSPLSSESDDNNNLFRMNNSQIKGKRLIPPTNVRSIFDKNDDKMIERKVITDPDREYIENTFINNESVNHSKSNSNIEDFIENSDNMNKFNNEIFNDDSDDNYNISNNSLYHFKMSNSTSPSSSQLSSTNHSYTNNCYTSSNNNDDLSDNLGPSPVPLLLPTKINLSHSLNSPFNTDDSGYNNRQLRSTNQTHRKENSDGNLSLFEQNYKTPSPNVFSKS